MQHARTTRSPSALALVASSTTNVHGWFIDAPLRAIVGGVCERQSPFHGRVRYRGIAPLRLGISRIAGRGRSRSRIRAVGGSVKLPGDRPAPVCRVHVQRFQRDPNGAILVVPTTTGSGSRLWCPRSRSVSSSAAIRSAATATAAAAAAAAAAAPLPSEAQHHVRRRGVAESWKEGKRR